MAEPDGSTSAPSPPPAVESGTGADPPGGPRRRTWKGVLLQIALLLVGVYFFVKAFQGVTLAELRAAVEAGSLPLLLLALLVAQLPRLTWAASTRAACPKPIPYRPVALLQFAVPFFNLVAPYTAARMAVNIRFFSRMGIAPASAVAISVIDTSAGFVVQVLLLVLLLVFGVGDANLDFHRSTEVDSGQLLDFLVGLIALFAVSALVAALVPALRRRALKRIRPWVRDVTGTLSALRSPSRVVVLLLGNLGSELFFGLTLGIVLRAYGAHASYATVLSVNVAVALFAGMLPIPGGIGVSEAALVIGLVAAGIDQATAVVCAISYRLCSYYLPPIWGWVAYRRLARQGLL